MRTVHTYMKLVQCPICHDTFMPIGDECCWRCAPETAPPTRAELTAARLLRQGAEMADGSLGSLAGLGFAPLAPAPVIFGAPRVRVAELPKVLPASVPIPEHKNDYWKIPLWAVVVGWTLMMIHIVISIVQHRPVIGP